MSQEQAGKCAAEKGMKTHIEKIPGGTCHRHWTKHCITHHTGIFKAMPKGNGALDDSMSKPRLRKRRQLP